jgi:flavin-dependent dehydrogenase
MVQKEICIVGAGPAGVITSLLLAKKGVPSVLIDKCIFPRHKACADTIPSSVIRQLNEIIPGFMEGLYLDKKSFELKGTIIYSPAGNSVNVDFLPLAGLTPDIACYSIPRILFDNELLNHAKANPLITVLEGHEVILAERRENGILIQFKHGKPERLAPLVIFCSGSNSIVYKNLLRLKTDESDYALGLRAYFQGSIPGPFPNHSELFLLKEFMPGGLFLAPMADGRYNVNLVISNEVVKKNKLNLNAFLVEQLKTNPVLKDRFKNSAMVGHAQGSRLFLGVKKRSISGDNFMLAGDAAGLIDLISANGIPQALVSAGIASDFAFRCVQTGDYSSNTLSGYDKEVFLKVKKYVQLNKLIGPWFSNNFLKARLTGIINFLVRHAQNNTALRDIMYSKNRVRILLNPLFYFKLFSGKGKTNGR